MSERNSARFNTIPNAQSRSPEEQNRLMDEFEAAETARYEEAWTEKEGSYDETMAAREYEENAATEGRILENPSANRMYMMAQHIAELRANGGDSEVIKDKEDKLAELLDAYSEEARSTRDAQMRAAEMERDTLKGREIRVGKEIAAEEELEARLAEAEFIINSTDEKWVNEKLKPRTKEDTVASTTEGTEPGDDEEPIPEVKTTGAEEDDDDDGETIPEVKTTGAEGDDDEETEDDPETRPPESLSATDRLRRIFDRGEREPGDRRRMIRRALGAVAVATVVVAGAVLLHRYGTDISSWLDSFNSNADAMGQPDVNTAASNFDGYIDTVDGNPLVTTPDTLPSSTGFDYPWNWAEKAVGGDQAMGFLEGLANKAEAAGHAVEWHGSGTTKWVEVDGNSNTQHVIDVLRQYQ